MKVGQVLGDRYRLEERIGQGGMSVVWRGTDVVLGRQVAVKVLAGASVTRRQAYHGSIRTDARAAASLSHPNVAAVFDYGEYTTRSGEQIPYVIMELLAGRSLAQRLRDGPLEPPVALRVCAQVAGALAAAHANGLVHRDIKPGNVVLTPSGAKVIDFGIAAAVGQADSGDPDAPVLGTAAYLAPERLAGGPVAAASDVYALGLLLFRALTNELPWTVETVTEMIEAHVYADPGPLPDLPGLPATVRELVVQCLAKEPQDRPSAGNVALELAEAGMIAPALDEEQLSLAVSRRTPGAHPSGARTAGARTAGAGPSGAWTPARPPAPDPAGRDQPPTDRAEPPPGPAPAPRRRLIMILGAVVAAVLVVAVLVPLLVRQIPLGVPGAASHPGPTSGSTQAANSAGPGATVGAGGTRDPHVDPTTPPAVAPEVSGAGQTTTGSSAPPTPATTSPSQTFETAGGTITAACHATMAVLTSWTPNAGFVVQNVTAGPADVARITFHSNAERLVVMARVTCATGTPIANSTTNSWAAPAMGPPTSTFTSLADFA